MQECQDVQDSTSRQNMYQLLIFDVRWKSTPPHYGIGQLLERSISFKHHVGSECTTSVRSFKDLEWTNKKREGLLCMPESLLLTKKKTLIDNCSVCSQSFQVTTRTAILDRVSIGTGKDFGQFWKEYTTMISEKLWLPIETDCVGLDSSCLNGSLRNIASNSWYSTRCHQQPLKMEQENWLKTYLQSLPTLLPKITVVEQVATASSDSNITGIHSIKLKPDPNQREVLNRWLGCFRFFYNQCVSLYKKFGKKTISLACLRNHLINDDALEKNGWGWARDIPYDVKDEALRDFNKALSINNKHRKCFDMRFKSRKHPTQCLVILKKHWGHKKGAYAFLQSISSSEPIPRVLPHDTRIVKKNGVFWLKLAQCSPLSRDDNTENQGRRSVVALDPGIRSFMTGYDPDGYAFEFGRNDYKRLHRLYHCTTKLQRLIASKTIRSRKRSKLKKVKARIFYKISNLVANLHYNMIKFLTSTYDAIIIPVFKVKDMISNRRYLNRRSKQHLSMWSHYQFRKRLKDRARLLGAKVYVVTEEFTSRTCTKCGHVCPKSSKKLKCCESCGHVTDRDVNGARNILMKSLTEAFENSKSGA